MAGSRQTDSVLIAIFKRAKITRSEERHIEALLENMPSLSYESGRTDPHVFRNSYRSAVLDLEIRREEKREIPRRAVKIRANRSE